VVAYRKNLTELAELELKHAKAQVQLLRNTLASLKEEASWGTPHTLVTYPEYSYNMYD